MECPREERDSFLFPERKRSKNDCRGVLGVSGGLRCGRLGSGGSPTLRSLRSLAVGGSSFGEVKLLGLLRSMELSAFFRFDGSMVGEAACSAVWMEDDGRKRAS